MLALWNESAAHDPLSADLLREKVWGDADFFAGGALAAFRDDTPEGFAVGVVRGAEDGPRGYVKMLAVHPSAQRRGCGGALLNALEPALAGRGARSLRLGESLPNYLVPGVDTRYASALRFFDDQGYRRFNEACNMTADLLHSGFATEEDESRLARSGVLVRRAARADGEAVQRFVQKHWPPWQHEVHCSMKREPPAVHLALQGGELLAFSAHDGNNAGSGSFGPMGTAPGSRGLGIGRVLLRRCLRDIRAAGFGQAIIPWVAPTGFYENHVGAVITRRFYRYEKILSP